MDKKENKKKTNKKETVQRNAKSKHNLCACTIRFSEPEQKKKRTAISDIFWSISLDGGGGEDEKRKLRLQRISVYTKFFLKE